MPVGQTDESTLTSQSHERPTDVPINKTKALNILVVEDDPTIRKSLVRGLSNLGHECDGERDGERALERALHRTPDLIVLDLMLPSRPGMDVLRELRKAGIKCPVIVLTALSSIEDRVEGLKLGADDYLVKPFSFDELVARIQAVTRRTTTQPAAVLHVGPLTLDLATRRASRGDTQIDLTPTEFSVLELLMRHDGQVVSRKMICRDVWGFEWGGSTNAIEVQINRLRRKLDSDGEESIIKTIRGRGYAIRDNSGLA